MLKGRHPPVVRWHGGNYVTRSRAKKRPYLHVSDRFRSMSDRSLLLRYETCTTINQADPCHHDMRCDLDLLFLANYDLLGDPHISCFLYSPLCTWTEVVIESRPATLSYMFFQFANPGAIGCLL